MTKIRPEAIHGIVGRAYNTIFSYQGWPSVCRDENGTLYAVASSFRAAHICPFGKTAMFISRDEGKTWTPPIVINDTYMDDRDAGILYMGNGRMLVTWFTEATVWSEWLCGNIPEMARNAVKGMIEEYEKLPDGAIGQRSFVRVSEDYGVTWSDTIEVPVSAPHGPSMLKNGTLIYLGKEAEDMYDGRIASCVSHDGGYTWTKIGIVDVPDRMKPGNFHEPHVTELSDGSLFGMIRVQGIDGFAHFTMYSTRSTDGGKTWSMPEPTDVSGSPPHLLRHSSGALICTYGKRDGDIGEHAMVSYDDGRTWSDDYIIDDNSTNPDLGYPATVELDDGSLLSVYYQRYADDINTSILCTRWKLKEKE